MTPRHPIIYIRGYAMTVAERNETAADPFCGFNIGSTVFRAQPDKQASPLKFVFESPLVRLVTEYQYHHVYQNGQDIVDPDWESPRDENGDPVNGISPASIIIHRYYDDGSEILGDGASRDVKVYAAKLNALILRVRQLVLAYVPKGGVAMEPDAFKCYLVAHSMGGLVARAFLQNTADNYQLAQKTVDKLFTFATPHNGIDVLGLNVPRWLTKQQMNTFNRVKMKNYLNLGALSEKFDGRVDLIPNSALASERIFCMVGTNRGDYEVGQGLTRAFVGHGSDGLVRIDNASLWGIDADDPDALPQQVATAYAFRAHSGMFGIVNSEEAYQNMVRFLFGDVRVDVWLDVDQVELPRELDGKQAISALYQFEFRASPLGKRWFLSRRASVEDSPAVRTHAQLTSGTQQERSIYLSSIFLSKRSKVDRSDRMLTYSMTIAAKVPDYQIDHKFWPDGHFEGADLFHGSARISVTPPDNDSGIGDWQVELRWLGELDAPKMETVNFQSAADRHVLLLPFASKRNPGLAGKVKLMLRPWS